MSRDAFLDDEGRDPALDAAFAQAVSGIEGFEPDAEDLAAFAPDEAELDPALAEAHAEAAERVVEELLERVGEAAPEPRLDATRRAVELLGDVHRAYSVIHLTGTNGKTSTARIAESLLRAHGLRTGLLTSPHLEKLNERILIDGRPISDERLVANWEDISPFLALVDSELEAKGEPRLTFFEALTVLGCACLADAPVDVAVVQVGMGGEWDSTNVMDGQVAVFTPIGLDHADRLGSTLDAIARTKAGIIKPGAAVVSAAQAPEALAELRERAEREGATLAVEGEGFALASDTLAVGGRLLSVRGLAGEYRDLVLPLAGRHQAENAALAIAAVEAFFGGDRPLAPEIVAQGLAEATSPGRLERIGSDPTTLIDAAHNPHGAQALAVALRDSFDFGKVALVFGVLEGKDAEGIIRALEPVTAAIVVTESESPRARRAEELAEEVRGWTAVEVYEQPDLREALELARELVLRDGERGAEDAAEHGAGAVLAAGSITVIGEARTIAREAGWLGQDARPTTLQVDLDDDWQPGQDDDEEAGSWSREGWDQA